MIAYAFYQGADSEWTKPTDAPLPKAEEIASSNPMKGIKGFKLAPPNLFDEQLIGIDFDCSGHPGAVGIFFPSAQKCLLLDVDVHAVGAHTGIHGIPGRNSGAANIGVTGGRFGLVLHFQEAGTTVVGLRLHGQTERALVCDDFVPSCLVGFEIKKKSSPVITIKDYKQTAFGTLALLDGVIDVEDRGLLIDNKAGKSVYLRNVYAKGPGAFIASGKLSAVGGAGPWCRVVEYCYTDQREPKTLPYEKGDDAFRTFSLIDGRISREAQPVSMVESDVQAPADYARTHLYAEFPQVTFSDSSKTINVMDAPYQARPDGSDQWRSIQRAIDDAERDGKMVYVPKGTFCISRTLELRAKTKLIGLGCKRNPKELLTAIAAHPSWKVGPENDVLIRTVDDANAETHLGGMNLSPSDKAIRRHIHWRAGRKSTLLNIGFPYTSGPTAETTIYFSGNGGGRHYFVEPQSTSKSQEHRHVRMVGTREPLSWYGCNLEAGSINMEMIDSRNIRIYGIKREGRSPTLVMKDCGNVAVYTQGAMREGIGEGSGGYIQIRGACDGILMPLILVQTVWGAPNGEPLLVETLDGHPKTSVVWPESISLYKRGKIDDGKLH
jgi:hypothetical protein